MSLTLEDQSVAAPEPAQGPTGPAGALAGVRRYVVVEINGSQYGIVTDVTVELMSGSAIPVTRVPKSPHYVRGVINHRGSIIPVVDTRALLGLQTAEHHAASVIETLRAHEREHVEWLESVEHAVKTGEPLDKQADAGPCAFGRWLKDTLSDPKKLQALTRYDPSIRGLLNEFDAPHARLHGLAEELLQLGRNGRRDEALERLAAAREGDLGELRRVFRRAVQALSKGCRTMLVITELGDRKAGFVVDAVHTVKDCADSAVDALPDSAGGGEFLRGLVHQPDGGYILICDVERMYELACPR